VEQEAGNTGQQGQQGAPEQTSGNGQTAKTPKPKKALKWLKWLGAAVAAPIGLVAAAAALLYSEPVQNWAVKKAAEHISEKTGMEASVDHVKLEFPLDLGIEGVKLIKPNDSIPGKKDTVADIGKIVADVKLKPLFKKQVEVDNFEIKDAKVNTTDFIPQARVKGKIGSLHVESHSTDLNKEDVMLNTVQLKDADIDVALSDTVPEDTTESENKWKIHVKDLDIDNSKVAVHTPGDTTQIKAKIGKLKAKDGDIDLAKGEYKVKEAKLKDSNIKYDNTKEKPVKGLDFNHIDVKDANLTAKDISYGPDGLKAEVTEASLKEKSGLDLKELNGKVTMDDKKLKVDNLHLKTSDSNIDGDIDMDLNAFDSSGKIPPGALKANLDTELGKQDLLRFIGSGNNDFVKAMPNYPVRLKGMVSGNLKDATLHGLNISMPNTLNMTASGKVKNLDDLDHLYADVNLCGTAQNVSFIMQLMDKDLRKTLTIPKNIYLCGDIKADGKRYDADLTMRESCGRAYIKGNYNMADDSYVADIKTYCLNLHHFLPHDSMYCLTATAKAKGKGFDVMSKNTKINAKADIRKFKYGSWNIDNVQAKAVISGGRAKADIDSDNKLLTGHINADALLGKNSIKAALQTELTRADLYRLRVFDKDVAVTACADLTFDSDLDEYYRVYGRMTDVKVEYDSGKVYNPGRVDLDVLTKKDTTHVDVDCGDLAAKFESRGGYKHLIKQFGDIWDEAKAGYHARLIDEKKIRKMFPVMTLYLKSGPANPVQSYLKSLGYGYDNLLLDLTSAPIEGLNGRLKAGKLTSGTVQIDTVNLSIVSDTSNVRLKGFVQNYKDNPTYVFRALLDGYLLPNGAGLMTNCYDDKDSLILNLGADATLAENGINLHLLPQKPVIGYKRFKVNDDNYVMLNRNKRVSAQIDLLADDGTGVKVYTNDENTEALQDITVSLNKLDLKKTLAVIPFMPRMEGILNGDFHAIQTDKELSVSSDVAVNNMVYEGCQMGNMSTEFVYMPRGNGEHFVDGRLMRDEQEIATIKGSYKDSKEGDLDAVLSLTNFPLDIVNGFIDGQLIGFTGNGNGDFDVKGTLSKPKVDGMLHLDSAYLVSVPYGMRMRFDTDSVRVSKSNLVLKDFNMYGYNDSPLTLNGSIDFSDLSNMMLNLRMRARDFLLINAEEQYNSVAYGKAYVNFFAGLRGPVDHLSLRGRLEVLGETDLAYILRDSPLSTDNQLEGLVEFVNFADTARVETEKPKPTGMDMMLSISVNDGAHILCYLNSDHSNYVDLTGGGDLKMTYTAAESLQLTGKYTLNAGEMKYSLPVIPLKTFTIQDGSYIEFTGDPMDPTLNITAEERTKATVSSDGGSSRSVTFDCGVKISKTLKDMGLEFVVSAPEDISVQSELSAMSTEQRGKIAVTLLTTGMYLTDGNTSAFSMNSALNSFLQNEINNITGNALRTVDMSFGMESGKTSTGEDYTSYSFKFAKRFWNNRLNVIVGGKVDTEKDPQKSNNTFFDNVTLEYRLDKTSNKNLKVFYQKNAYDWLEGNLTKYGLGFVWRRKLQNFKDIFNFKSTQEQLPPPPSERRDSTRITVKYPETAADSTAAKSGADGSKEGQENEPANKEGRKD